MTSLAVPPPSARAASGGSPRSAETVETTRLFEENSERILAYCLRRLGSRTEAEDAVQTTFLYAFRALQRGVVPTSERAWLLAIAKNACRWQRRTLSRRGALSSEHDLDGFAGPPTLDGEDASQLCRDLKEALKAIPASQRRALVLREWHGLSIGEVAERLELSTPATYALLTRARRSFMVAYAARREALLSLQLGTLLYQLKYQLKALFGTASAKAALATVAVVGAGAGGVVVVVERSLDGDGPPLPVPASAIEPARAVPTTGQASTTAGQASTARRQPAALPGSAGVRAEPDGGSATAVVVLPRSPSDPAPAPAPGLEQTADPSSTEPTASPTADPLPATPLDPLPLPEIELPTDLLPPVELPPLEDPTEDLPVDVPPLPLDIPEPQPLPDLPGPLP